MKKTRFTILVSLLTLIICSINIFTACGQTNKKNSSNVSQPQIESNTPPEVDSSTTSYNCEVNGHSYILNQQKTPTCHNTGFEHYTCIYCNDEYTESTPALGCEYSAEGWLAKEPTCTEEGELQFGCIRHCTGYRSETIASLGCDLQPVKTQTPCTFNIQKRVCSRNCGREEFDIVSTASASNHANLKAGDICSRCGFECYVKDGADLLMLNTKTNEFFAEYYEKNATRKFDTYGKQIQYVYLSELVENIQSGAFANDTFCYLPELNQYTTLNPFYARYVIFHKESKLRAIGYSAFRNSLITQISLPNTLEVIHESAFANSDLTQITLPQNLKILDSGAFYQCDKLESITISTELTKVGINPFENTAWWNIQPDGIVYIDHICLGVKGEPLPLNSIVELPSKTTVIAEQAFYNEGGLRKVIAPKNLVFIGESAFEYCSALLDFSFKGGSETETTDNGFIGYRAFGSCVSLNSIEIPSEVSLIASSAFSGCTALVSVNFAKRTAWTIENGSILTAEQFSDHALIAEYLTDTYQSYSWEKQP